MARQNSTHFDVIPVYTSGSPEQVDLDTAERVALEEKTGHERALSGVYGPEKKRAAERRGTFGIVFSWREKKRGAIVHDFLASETFEFKRFEEFQRWTTMLRADTHGEIETLVTFTTRRTEHVRHTSQFNGLTTLGQAIATGIELINLAESATETRESVERDYYIRVYNSLRGGAWFQRLDDLEWSAMVAWASETGVAR